MTTKTPKHKYDLKIYNGRVKVYIDGIAFLWFNQIDFKGIYAYKDDTDLYGVDIVLKDTTIETFYKTKEVWLAVLKILDERL